MGMESHGGMTLAGENRVTRKKTCLSAQMTWYNSSVNLEAVLRIPRAPSWRAAVYLEEDFTSTRDMNAGGMYTEEADVLIQSADCLASPPPAVTALVCI
jgi:hypothetical protein